MPLYVLHDNGEFYYKKTKLTIGEIALPFLFAHFLHFWLQIAR